MATIEISQEMNHKLAEHREKLRAMAEALRPYANEREQRELNELCEGFEKRCTNVLQENRLLNIGIVGQVKAGKSSFLNTLLFDGKTVLPKAATPKTAVLTKIEYGAENKIIVQYIPQTDWEELQNNARIESEESFYRAAREIVEAQRESGVVPAEVLGKEIVYPFDSIDALESKLNEFVGDNGKYTPLTLSVTLKMNRPELQDISVVDTPGVNDSVVSRTHQTRRFLEECDVIFFLSSAGQFLDETDWRLLFNQIPNTGVKKLVLLGSKIDDPLRSEISLPDEVIDPLEGNIEVPGVSIEEGLSRLRQKLTEVAADAVKKNRAVFEEQNLRNCDRPIFISSIMENMRKKPENEYDAGESAVAKYYRSFFGENKAAQMEDISSFSLVRKEYQDVVHGKEEILQKVLDALLPDAEGKCISYLESLRAHVEKRKNAISQIDRAKVDRRCQELERQMNGVTGDIKAAVQDINSEVGKKKKEIMDEMSDYADKVSIQEHTGSTDVHHEGYTTYKFKFLFVKLGREYHPGYTTKEYYQYVAAADAIEALEKYAKQLSQGLNAIFENTFDISELRKKMLNSVVLHLNTSDESFDAGLCKEIAVDTLNEITIPTLSFAFDGINDIQPRFSKEIRDNREKESFFTAIRDRKKKMLDAACGILEQTVGDFTKTMNSLPDKFTEKLKDNILKEYDVLLGRVNDTHLIALFRKHSRSRAAKISTAVNEGNNHAVHQPFHEISGNCCMWKCDARRVHKLDRILIVQHFQFVIQLSEKVPCQNAAEEDHHLRLPIL